MSTMSTGWPCLKLLKALKFLKLPVAKLPYLLREGKYVLREGKIIPFA